MTVLRLQLWLQMGLGMAGKVRHFVERKGRYFARLVVPKDLREAVGKTELRTALGGDRRQALIKLPAAVANLQTIISQAEHKVSDKRNPPRYPMSPEAMTAAHYQSRLDFDDELRNDPRWANGLIDDVLVERLRRAIAGRSSDDELHALVGVEIARFRRAGNFDSPPGSDAWRTVAKGLCIAELEALERVCERDEGDFTGQPSHPILKTAVAVENAAQGPEPVSLKKLWTDYVAARQAAGFMKGGAGRLGRVFESLRAFVGHDDAARVVKKDLLAWRDDLTKTLAAKTISDVYLSTARSVFTWAVDQDLITENPVIGVKIAKPRKVLSRERGFTDGEALAVLKASRAYQPNVDQNGYQREKPHLVNAKKWVPLLAAFSGARVSELTQLRKEDFRQEDDVWIMRITPDAGTVKAGGFRDVPLHPQILDQGFIGFVATAKAGPLFHGATTPDDYARKAGIISNQLANWLRGTGLRPDGLQPNHAWRHRFKTVAMDLELAPRVVDALQGHAARTAGEGYGDVSIRAKTAAINKFPAYDI